MIYPYPELDDGGGFTDTGNQSDQASFQCPYRYISDDRVAELRGRRLFLWNVGKVIEWWSAVVTDTKCLRRTVDWRAAVAANPQAGIGLG